MDDAPLISVIMGIYNCARTLPDAVKCIQDQTCPDWELIMCDDGSGDDTYEVAERLAEKDGRIMLLQNEHNMGLNVTLNRCLSKARGKYIARMDGDDLCSSDRFEKEKVFLETHKEFAIVSTGMHFFDENGVFRTIISGGEVDYRLFAKTTQILHAPCMVRKEAFDAVGGYAVRDDRLRVEDWDLWIRMCEKGFRAYRIPEALYSMRDDHSAYKRRKFKYRINEAKVSASAVKKLKLPAWNYVYTLRPLIIGLLPPMIYNKLHKR